MIPMMICFVAQQSSKVSKLEQFQLRKASTLRLVDLFGGEFVLVVFCITFKATRNKGRLADVGNIPILAFALEAFLFNSSFKNHSFGRKCGAGGASLCMQTHAIRIN